MNNWPQPPALHPAQAEIVRQAARYNVIDCGVRFGKTELCKWLILGPLKSGRPVAWYAPTYKTLEEVWRATKGLFVPIATRISDQMHRIEVPNGGVLEMWSLDDPDASIGRKYARVVVDEAAKVRHLEYSWEHVISSRLIDYHGDAFLPSTPKGMNYFHTLFVRGQNGGPDWRSFQFPTSANPYIDPQEIEARRLELPERIFRQEYLAEFVTDGSYFQNIDTCCVLEQPDSPADHAGHTFGLGLDWGKANDFTSGTIGCRECDRVVDWFRFNSVDYSFQRARIVEYVKKWPDCRMLPERNSIGEVNIEELRAVKWEDAEKHDHFISVVLGPDNKPGFQTTVTTKPSLIELLYLALQRGKQFPREYADEFRAYEVQTRSDGYPKYSAPEGMHDDRVISAALETWLAGSALQIF